MTALQNPKTKLLLALALLGGLLAASAAQGVGGATVARLLLGLSALAALGWWGYRRRGAEPGAPTQRRMQVLDRTGLSPRCGLALVAIDGREFLVAYGDGFAEIQVAAEAPVTKARRPFPKPRPVQRRRAGGGR